MNKDIEVGDRVATTHVSTGRPIVGTVTSKEFFYRVRVEEDHGDASFYSRRADALTLVQKKHHPIDFESTVEKTFKWKDGDSWQVGRPAKIERIQGRYELGDLVLMETLHDQKLIFVHKTVLEPYEPGPAP